MKRIVFFTLIFTFGFIGFYAQSQEFEGMSALSSEHQVQGLNFDDITILPTDTDAILSKKILILREQNKQLQARVIVLQKTIHQFEKFAQKKVQEVVVLKNYADAMHKDYEQLLKDKESMLHELKKMQIDKKKLLEAYEALNSVAQKDVEIEDSLNSQQYQLENQVKNYQDLYEEPTILKRKKLDIEAQDHTIKEQEIIPEVIDWVSLFMMFVKFALLLVIGGWLLQLVLRRI